MDTKKQTEQTSPDRDQNMSDQQIDLEISNDSMDGKNVIEEGEVTDAFRQADVDDDASEFDR